MGIKSEISMRIYIRIGTQINMRCDNLWIEQFPSPTTLRSIKRTMMPRENSHYSEDNVGYNIEILGLCV